MAWAFLIVSVLGVIHAANALNPRKRPVAIFAWSFFASWLTIEIVWHHGRRMQDVLALAFARVVAGVEARAQRRREQAVKIEAPIAFFRGRDAERRSGASGQRGSLRGGRVEPELGNRLVRVLSLDRQRGREQRAAERSR